MKLREFNFNSLKNLFALINLCVMDGRVSYEGVSIGDTLRMLPIELADRKIKETRWFFNTFVIELEQEVGIEDAVD